MALKNVFDAIATEGTLRRILNQLQLARDSSDRLRIIIDAGTVTTVTGVNSVNSFMWGSANTEPAYYSTGAPNSMDAREQQRIASQSLVAQNRARWTIT